MRNLLITYLIMIGCKNADSNFVTQCEKNQNAQKVAVQQSGMASGMTDALLDYNCQDLLNRYGTTCKEQVKKLDSWQQSQFYSSCIISEHTKVVSMKMMSDILSNK